MSPRAALRLTQLGFEQVHDYGPGKSDWLAAGLPTEGHAAGRPTAGRAARQVPTCALDTPLAEARAAAGESPVTVVVAAGGVVVGDLRWERIDEADDGDAGAGGRRAVDAMRPGPTTVRCDEDPGPLALRMERAGVGHVLVTAPDGRLAGLVTVEAARQAAG